MPKPRPVIAFAVLLFVALGLEAVPASGGDSAQPVADGPIVREAVHHDTSLPLRDLIPVSMPEGARNEAMRPLPRPVPGPGGEVPDPALQTGGSADTAPPPSLTFAGNGNNENSPFLVNPPDTVGDVGPNHYVQMVNLVYSVYSKSGTRLLGPLNNNMIWLGFAGSACQIHNWGDPIVLYDQAVDRWLLSQFAFAREPLQTGLPVPPFYQCIAISQTGDPTGAFHRYEFLIDDNQFNDYPHFGVWPDAYYMSINQFDATTAYNYSGPGAVAFERAQMLTGGMARMVYFDLSTTLGTSHGGQLPSDWDGATPPPAGSPNYFVEASDKEIFPAEYNQDQLTLYKFLVDWTTPANSTFGVGPNHDPNAEIPTAPFDTNLCAFARDCIPQKDVGTADEVDALSDRIMHRLQYRNFGTHEVLVANQTVDVGDTPDHAGIRWYEVRDPGGSPAIFQQGTYSPDAEHRWMGSVAMDGAGNMGLGYSVSSSTSYPSIRYTGRLAGDSLGTMQDEVLMFAGSGSQQASGNRWGDYSAMNVDPTDDCTFWYTQEFYPATGTFGWRTRIGSFRFPLCGDLALTLSDAPDPVEARSDLTYTARVLTGATPVTQVTFTDPLPAGVTFVSATPSHGTCTGGSTVTCNLGDLGVGVLATVDIVVRTGGAAMLSNTASITSSSPDPQLGNNTATVVTAVEDRCFAPGLTLVSDPTGDALTMLPAHDIQRVSIAEPFLGDGVNKLVFTIKMASLSTIPPNTRWPLTFSRPGPNPGFADDKGYFVDMTSDASAAITFNYGTVPINATTGVYNGNAMARVGAADAESNFNANGTITIVLSNSKLVSTGQTTPPQAGDSLTRFLLRVRSPEGGSQGAATPDNAPGDLNATGSYTLAGNAFCKPLDLAVTKEGPEPRTPTGRTMNYTINVTNNGPGTATGVVLSDTLPGSVIFVSASATQGTCSGTATVTCLLGTINAGNTVTVTIQVKPTQAGVITNTATAVLHEVDGTTANNTAVDTTNVCRITSRRSSIPCG
jgi:uncharacterized repeat protein (TIGR01451 family)